MSAIVHAFLITGERDWQDSSVVEAELLAANRAAKNHGLGRESLFIIGDCPTGVDKMAKALCEYHQLAFEEVLVDPDLRWPEKGGERNARMVRKAMAHKMYRKGPVSFIAFWSGKEKRSGTYNCFQQAVAAGLNGTIIARRP